MAVACVNVPPMASGPLIVTVAVEYPVPPAETVKDEIDPLDAARVRRIVLCSGRVYFDLLKTRRERGG